MTATSATRTSVAFSTTAVLVASGVLAACSGGGGGSPTAQMPDDPGASQPPMVTEPMTPATPVVDGNVTVENAAAIDPTLSFRAVRLPATAGFSVSKTVPDSPVTVFTRHDHPDAPTPPTDLDAMAARAALLWTRSLTDRGTHPVDLFVGYPEAEQCPGTGNACAYRRGGHRSRPDAGISLPDVWLSDASTHNRLAFGYFKTIVHEVGHTLEYRSSATGTGHADCMGTQVMCATPTINSPASPEKADFDGLRNWAVGPPVPDYQDFGLWATSVTGTDSNLQGFGVTVTRTLTVEEGVSAGAAADKITDTIRIEAEVHGTPTAGPATGMGTATWSGIFLGADTDRFEPVTGDATLTANLDDLASIDLALSGLKRTDASGAAHPLATIAYELDRHSDAWIDAAGRADARFYAAGADPAGAAAGIVSDAGRDLAGAWGAVNN